MKDYRDLYLKCEVLLLADVLGKFRTYSFKNYGLCPSHYLSAPGLSWDAMLKMTKNKLELIIDSEMYKFFEKGTKGGIDIFLIDIAKPKINILSLLTQNKNPNIKYLEANNLYGYAMSKFLPTSGFKWIDPKQFDLNEYTSNSSKGCVFEVDFEYRKELQEFQNNYPLASDKIENKREMLSESQLKIADLYNIPIENVKKLVPNFFDK